MCKLRDQKKKLEHVNLQSVRFQDVKLQIAKL